MKSSKYFRSVIKLFQLLIIIFAITLSNTGLAYALTQQDFDAIQNNTAYYDESEACKNEGDAGGANANTAGDAANDYPIRVPYIKDAAKLAQAIDDYTVNYKSNSPFVGMGKYFVQGGMRAGINPILAVAQATMESQMGTAPNSGGIDKGSNNAFGRTASDRQPGVFKGTRKWYQWPSFQESIYAKTYPSSGRVGQPNDWFQYISEVFALDSGLQGYLNGAEGKPAYAPAFENNLPVYIENVTKITNQIVEKAGDAIDITKKGTATPSTGGTSTAQEGTTPTGPVVAIDPGHGGVVNQYIDPVTGLGDLEYVNEPEATSVQDVSNILKTVLETAGYKVVMLKTNTNDSVSKRQRVDAAKNAGAAIAVSIHTDSGSGAFENWGETWPQVVGHYRQSQDNPAVKVSFSNQETAQKSATYANIINEERDKAERGGKGITKVNTDQAKYFPQSRGLPSWGNLSLVQLWSDSVPWVYNEAGSPTGSGGLTPEQKLKYAAGIANGIKRALPVTPASIPSIGCPVSKNTASGNTDGITNTILSYAWPEYRAKGTSGATDRKPEYATAITTAKSKSQYIGGCDGVDCGAFVSRVIIDSGFDPRYNYDGKGGNTTSQERWTRENWQLLTVNSTADLQPGDVAFTPGHTYMYAGKIAGFNSEIASASLCGRAPMAGKESPVDNQARWYRKK